jgi:hypothetical protein
VVETIMDVTGADTDRILEAQNVTPRDCEPCYHAQCKCGQYLHHFACRIPPPATVFNEEPRGLSSRQTHGCPALIQDDSSLMLTDQLAFQVIEHRLNALDFL